MVFKRALSLLCATSLLAVSINLPAEAQQMKLPGKGKKDIAKYLADKPPQLQEQFTSIPMEGDRNAVLNFMRTGLAAMELGYDDVATQSFDEALRRIETVYADNKNAEKARSKFVKESNKDFKGEPYERAMAYYYRGLLYLKQGDYENARASFRGGQLQDAFAEDMRYASDFALFDVLSGWSSQCLGETSQAQDFYTQAKSVRPTVPVPGADDHVLLIADLGIGPYKVSDGKYNENLRFRQDLAFDERSVVFSSPEIAASISETVANTRRDLDAAREVARVAQLGATAKEARAKAAEAEVELSEIALRNLPPDPPPGAPADGQAVQTAAAASADGQAAPAAASPASGPAAAAPAAPAAVAPAAGGPSADTIPPVSGPQVQPPADPVPIQPPPAPKPAAKAEAKPEAKADAEPKPAKADAPASKAKAAKGADFDSAIASIVATAAAEKRDNPPPTPVAAAPPPPPPPPQLTEREKLTLAISEARTKAKANREEADAAKKVSDEANAGVAAKEQLLQSSLQLASLIGADTNAAPTPVSAAPAPAGATATIAQATAAAVDPAASAAAQKRLQPITAHPGESLYWQASTRGGRPVDGILAGKAEFKAGSAELSSQTGEAALYAVQGASSLLNQAASLQAQGFNVDTSGATALAGVGVGLALFSALAGAASAAAKPQADIRYWDNLPAELDVAWAPTAGSYTATFLDQSGAPLRRAPVKVVMDRNNTCGIGWLRTRSAAQIPASAPNATDGKRR